MGYRGIFLGIDRAKVVVDHVVPAAGIALPIRVDLVIGIRATDLFGTLVNELFICKTANDVLQTKREGLVRLKARLPAIVNVVFHDRIMCSVNGKVKLNLLKREHFFKQHLADFVSVIVVVNVFLIVHTSIMVTFA